MSKPLLFTFGCICGTAGVHLAHHNPAQAVITSLCHLCVTLPLSYLVMWLVDDDDSPAKLDSRGTA